MRRLFPTLIAVMLFVSAGCHPSHPPIAVPSVSAAPVAPPPVIKPKMIPRKITPRYTIADVGTLPGFDASEGIGINNHGWIVANAVAHTKIDNYLDESRFAFLSYHGILTALTHINCSAASAINNREEVTGRAFTSLGGFPKPFLYTHQKMKILSNLGYTDASGAGINDQGMVVINSTDGDNETSFLYWHGKTHKIPQPARSKRGNEEEVVSCGINLHRQILVITGAGSSLYKDGRFQSLNQFKLPGYFHFGADTFYGSGHCLNDLGDIVGSATQPDGMKEHGFWYSAGRIHDLGTLPGYKISNAEAINNHRQIVGLVYNTFDKETIAGHAFLYGHGQMRDLNDLISANSGWLLIDANGINDRGQIVGTGKHNGKTRAFVLTPIGMK